MKKNLNIAYLNGAEGMIRRGGASSGGSGDSGGSAKPRNSWKYFDLRNTTMTAGQKHSMYAMMFHIGKWTDNIISSVATGYAMNPYETMIAVGVDTEGFIYAPSGTIVTMGELYNMKGLFGPNDIWTTFKEYSIIEITEDEFLNLT